MCLVWLNISLDGSDDQITADEVCEEPVVQQGEGNNNNSHQKNSER